MSHEQHLSSDSMDGVIFEHEEHQPHLTTQSVEEDRRAREAIETTNPSLCPESETSSSLSRSAYVDNHVVQPKEGSEIHIVETSESTTGKERIAGAKEENWENDRKLDTESEMLSSNNTGASDKSDLSDMDVEVGDFDLEDIMEIERTIAVDDGYNKENNFQRIEDGIDSSGGKRQAHRAEDQAATTTSTPLYPPGLDIPLRPSRPPPFFNDADAGEESEGHRFLSQIPKINGIEVCMAEVELTMGDVDLYSDPKLGQWRVKILSPLRMCWMPLERWNA